METESTRTTTTTVIRPTPATSLGLLLLRLPLGAYFLVASIMKFKGGVAAFVDQSLPMVPKYMGEHYGRMFLGALPWVELTVGSLLILGFLTRFVGLVMTLLLICITIALVGAKGNEVILGKLASDTRLPFHPNLLLLGMSLAVMLCGPGQISLDGLLFRPRRRRVVVEGFEVDEPSSRRPNLDL
ncbi:MAG TPA: DoxX family protein [Tepidisphaeraceae bacterium]|jgi:uncharacterized membrane protein YphA (DoxX/SURF4 family)